MNWGSFDAFLAMGGYGLYVWGSYGVAALCVAVEIWSLARRGHRARVGMAARKMDASANGGARA